MRRTKPTQLIFLFQKQFILLILIAFLLACNNEKATSDEKTNSTELNNSTSPIGKTTIASLSDFPVLCIDTIRLKQLWANNNVRKLVFQFNIDNRLTHNPSLTAYQANPNGRYIGGAVLTLDRRDVVFNFPGEILLGDLELLRTDYNNMPNTSKAGFLLFFPTLSRIDNKSVTYKLVWGNCNALPDTEGLVAPNELNPSPPADPQ